MYKTCAWIPLIHIKRGLVIKQYFIIKGQKKMRKYTDTRFVFPDCLWPNSPSVRQTHPRSMLTNTTEETWYILMNKLKANSCSKMKMWSSSRIQLWFFFYSKCKNKKQISQRHELSCQLKWQELNTIYPDKLDSGRRDLITSKIWWYSLDNFELLALITFASSVLVPVFLAYVYMHIAIWH